MKIWLKTTAVFVLFSVLIPVTAVYFPKIYSLAADKLL